MEITTRYHVAVEVKNNLADVLVKLCREAIDEIVAADEGAVHSFVLQYDSYLNKVILSIELADVT